MPKHDRASVDLYANGSARVVVRCHDADRSPAMVIEDVVKLLKSVQLDYADPVTTAMDLRCGAADESESRGKK